MDSSLSSFQDNTSQILAVANETSRCARCVKDKKGCDRLYPCSRCNESGLSDSCVYTGAIHRPRLRLGRRRATLENSRSATAQMTIVSSPPAGVDHDDEDDMRPILPGDRRRRKLRLSNGNVRSRRSLDKVASETSIVKNWFEEAPEEEEDHVEPVEHEKSDEEIARTKIYNGFSDIVTHLPVEIYRSTTFIRALDLSYHDKCSRLDSLCRDLQQETSANRVMELRSEIVQLMQESSEDRGESIVEAAKLQTLVESHISILSAEIEGIESPQSMASVALEAGFNTKPAVKKSQKHRKQTNTGDHDDGMDIPIDEDEPTYCYCQRVSFGKMIACENEECEGGEWFHFECLGWTSAPRGKWWCRVCTEAGFGSKKFVRRVQELDGRAPEDIASPAQTNRALHRRAGRGRTPRIITANNYKTRRRVP